jgi:hypothetical protein
VGVRSTAGLGCGSVGSGDARVAFGQGRQGAMTHRPRQQYQVLNWFKPSQSIQTRSNLFQIISKLIRSKKVLSELKKIQNKILF